MLAFFFDSTVYNLFKNKWQLEEERQLLTYNLPKLAKIKYNDDNPEEIILFKYPTHYRHLKFGQYNIAFAGYFTILGSITMYIGLKNMYKSYKTLIAMSIISLFCAQEAYIGYTRVKDVKSIILKNGKTVVIETFQDGNIKYETDLKDIRITNKDKTELLILVDVNHARSRNFRFFFAEPTPGTVNNLNLFQTVFLDERYIKY